MVKDYVAQYKDLVDYFIICSQDEEELKLDAIKVAQSSITL